MILFCPIPSWPDFYFQPVLLLVHQFYFLTSLLSSDSITGDEISLHITLDAPNWGYMTLSNDSGYLLSTY